MRGWPVLLAGLTLLAQPLFAGEVETGLLGVGTLGAQGAAFSFSGAATQGPWVFGGYGFGLWTPMLSLAGGGALVGVRPLPPLTVSARVGLGAGFHTGDAGATRQWGADVSLATPWDFVLAASWDRVGNLDHLNSLPPEGCEVWGLGIRLRFTQR